MAYPIEKGEERPRSGLLAPRVARRLGAALEAMPRRLLGTIVALLLVLVTVADTLTPASVVVSVFYVIPIIIASCWLGARAAFLSVLLGGIGVMVAQTLGPAGDVLSMGTRVWNASALTILFVGVAAIQSALCASLAYERELGRTDPVTGVANARYFMQLAFREQRRARRYRTPLTVGYIGIERLDDARADSGSRRTAEQHARDVALALAGCVREIDVLARMAPGEFAVWRAPRKRNAVWPQPLDPRLHARFWPPSLQHSRPGPALHPTLRYLTMGAPQRLRPTPYP